MGWRSLPCLIALACCPTAAAESLEAVLDRSAHLLETGQAMEALRCCREARVEYPESAELLFALGSAEAAAGDRQLRDHATDAAAEAYRAARESFDRAAAGDAPYIREGAAYNAATSLVRLDTALDQPGAYAARLENLEQAVAALESVLKQYPGHERAQKNLDYARYKLNVLRQNPPQEEKPPEDDPEDQDPKVASEVDSATTEIPDATAEVVGGSTVVLRLPPVEAGP